MQESGLPNGFKLTLAILNNTNNNGWAQVYDSTNKMYAYSLDLTAVNFNANGDYFGWVRGASFKEGGKVVVYQTMPSSAGQLQLAATVGELQTKSKGFSVAAIPVKVTMGNVVSANDNIIPIVQPSAKDTLAWYIWGGLYPMTFGSDSDVPGDLNEVQISESVKPVVRKGYYKDQMLTTSGFQVQDGTNPQYDVNGEGGKPEAKKDTNRADELKDLLKDVAASDGQSGDLEAEQYFVFADLRTGMKPNYKDAAVIPSSGFYLKYHVDLTAITVARTAKDLPPSVKAGALQDDNKQSVKVALK